MSEKLSSPLGSQRQIQIQRTRSHGVGLKSFYSHILSLELLPTLHWKLKTKIKSVRQFFDVKRNLFSERPAKEPLVIHEGGI